MSNYYLSLGGGTSKTGVKVGGTSADSASGTSKFKVDSTCPINFLDTVSINGTDISTLYQPVPSSSIPSSKTQPMYIDSTGAFVAATPFASATVGTVSSTDSVPASGVSWGDYVVAQGIDNGTTQTNCVQYWRRWNSGYKEVWSKYTYTGSMAVTSSWGSLYFYNGSITITWPTAANNTGWVNFTQRPIQMIRCSNDSKGQWCASFSSAGTVTVSNTYTLMRASSTTVPANIIFYCYAAGY